MSALRPLFAAAGALLLIALVVLAVRSGDDTATPSADGTVAPGETATDGTPVATPDATPDPTVTEPDDAPTPDDDATSPDATATDGATSRPSDDTSCGVACGDDEDGDGTSRPQDSGDGTTGTDGSSDGSDDGTDDGSSSGSNDGGSDDGSSEGDDDGREVVAIGDVDDMPNTGGGAVALGGGLVAFGAAAATGRRR